MSVGIRYYTSPETGETRKVYVVRYRDQERKYRQGGTFERKRDADAKDAQIKVELQKGIHQPASTSCTVGEAAALWLERVREDELEALTIENYERLWRLHIEPATVPAEVRNGWKGKFGDIRLSELKTPTCVVFRRALLKSRARTHRGVIIPDKPISRLTAKSVLARLKGILKEAQVNGMITYNPALPVSIQISDREKIPLRIGHEIPDRSDIRSLLAGSTGMWHVLILTGAFTGMRASEMRGLIWRNVDLDKHVIHVWQRADGKRRIGKCKTGAGYRDIHISDVVVDELSRWKLICPTSSLGLVFPGLSGEILWHQTFLKFGWHPVQHLIGMLRPNGKPKYRFHGLRHFYASLMIDRGVPAKRLQGLLGHATLTMTMDLYGHLFPESEEDTTRMDNAVASVLAAD